MLVTNHYYFYCPYSLTNILLKHVCQVILEYQVQQVIGMQDCPFRSC